MTTRVPAWLRRVWPWLVGIAILAVIATRIPVAAFRDAMSHGPHHWLAALDLVVAVTLLFTESAATWVGLWAARMRRPFLDVTAVRGATFLLFLINYTLGQGGFGYYLHRTGTSGKRALGATLFLMGTTLATLLLLTGASWVVDGSGVPNRAFWWTVTIGCAGFGAYLVVIAVAPSFLKAQEWLAPLFDAGLRGHAAALLGRVPHVLTIVFSHWAAMQVWGIESPVVTAVTIVPAIALAAALPISPGGLGTTQAATVFFFSSYAAGATEDERAATVLAFSIVHFVYSVLAAVLVGLICLPLARRIRALPAAGESIVNDVGDAAGRT